MLLSCTVICVMAMSVTLVLVAFVLLDLFFGIFELANEFPVC